MSSRIARVNALEVAIRNDESSKLRRRGVLAAERAQRRDEPSALPRGRVGGSQAESHEFGLRLARDDVEAGVPQPREGDYREAPLTVPLGGGPGLGEPGDGDEQKRGHLAVIARRVPGTIQSEYLRGPPNKACRLAA